MTKNPKQITPQNFNNRFFIPVFQNVLFWPSSQAAASFSLVLTWELRWLVNSQFRNPDPKLCCRWCLVPWQLAGWPWTYCLTSACHPLFFGEVTNVIGHREMSAGHSNAFVFRILSHLQAPLKHCLQQAELGWQCFWQHLRCSVRVTAANSFATKTADWLVCPPAPGTWISSSSLQPA